MRIGLKIIAGFLVVALLIGVVGYVAAVSFSNVEEQFNEFEQHAVNQIRIFGSIKDALHMALIAVNTYVITGDEVFKERALSHLEQMEEAEAGYVNVAEGEFVDKIKNRNSQAKAQIIRLIEAYEAGASEETLLEHVNGLAATSEEIMGFYHGTIDAHYKAHQEEATTNVRNTFNAGSMAIATLAIVSLILAIGLGLFISRSISRPVTKLRDAAREIGKGNLDAKIEVASKDETGELASAFNQMTRDLKKSGAEIEEYSRTLEKQVAERTKELEKSKKELEAKVDELEKFIRVTVGRELRMAELKRKMKELGKRG